MDRNRFCVCASLLVLAAVVPRPTTAAALESPPTLVTQWRTEGDRLPTDFFAVAPDKIYLVDESNAGTAWTLQHSLLFGFSTVNPITNDKGDLYDVAVAPDGRIFAVDIPPMGGVPGRLWQFAANGSRLGSSPLGPTAPIIGDALAVLDSQTLLLAVVSGSGIGAFERLQMDGTALGPWGPSLPAGWEVTGLDIAVSGTGDVFVSDGYGHRVLRFDPAGNLSLSWGQRGSGEGEFDQPGGIAVDEAGDVYVADYGNNRVQKFTPAGQFLVQWGGSCNLGPCTDLSLQQPSAIACFPGGLVAVGTRSRDAQNAPLSEVKVFQMADTPVPVHRVSWSRVKVRWAPNGDAAQPGADKR